MNDNIKVSIRIRPEIEREKRENEPILWESTGNTVSLNCNDNRKNDSNAFTFDTIFTPQSTNEDIFKQVVKPIIDDSFDGYNGTVFAYGQTASGKTYTMTGNDTNLGVIPLAMQYIFQYIEKTPGRTYLLRVSFIEIYNEFITDLLDKNQKPLKIYEDINGMPYIGDVTEVVVTSASELMNQLEEGQQRRQFGETSMNERSSRSHTIFKMVIESHCSIITDEEVVISHVNLVDLAGSEKCGQMNSNQSRFKEGCRINLSLLALTQVISKLSEGNNQFINYRDSKLTRILKPSLGGNSKTAIICNISPCVYEESLSTLKFADRARSIKNKPKINAILCKDSLLRKYESQIQQLKEELQQENKSHRVQLLQQELNERDTRITELQEKLKCMSQKLIVSSHHFNLPEFSKIQPRRETWCAPVSLRHMRIQTESRRSGEFNFPSTNSSINEDIRKHVGIQTDFQDCDNLKLHANISTSIDVEQQENITSDLETLKNNYNKLYQQNEELSLELHNVRLKSTEQEAALFNYETQLAAIVNDISLLDDNDKECNSEETIEKLLQEQQILKSKLESSEIQLQEEKDNFLKIISDYNSKEELLEKTNATYKSKVEELTNQIGIVRVENENEQENLQKIINDLKFTLYNLEKQIQNEQNEFSSSIAVYKCKEETLEEINSMYKADVQALNEKMFLVESENTKAIEASEKTISELKTSVENSLQLNEFYQVQLSEFGEQLLHVEREKELLNREIQSAEERLQKCEVEIELFFKNKLDLRVNELNEQHAQEISQLLEENQMNTVVINDLKNELIKTIDENEYYKESLQNERSTIEELKRKIDEQKTLCQDSAKSLEENNSILDSLKSTITTLEDKLASEKNNWEEKISTEFEKQNEITEKYEVQIADLLKMNTEFKTWIKELRTEFNSAFNEIHEEIKLTNNTIKLHSEDDSYQRENIIKDLEAIKNKFNEKEDEYENYVFNLSEEFLIQIDNMENDLDQYQKKNTQLLQEKSKYELLLNDVTESCSEKIDDLTKLVRDKEKAMLAIENEFAEERHKNILQIELLKVQENDLKKLLKDHEEKNRTLSENLQSKQLEIDRMTERESVFQETITSLEEGSNKWQSLLQKFEAEIENLSEKLKQSERENYNLQETLTKEKENLEKTHNNQLSNLSADKLQIQHKYDRLVAEKLQFEEELNDVNRRNLNLEKNIEEKENLENAYQKIREDQEIQGFKLLKTLKERDELLKQIDELHEAKRITESEVETSQIRLHEMIEKEKADHLVTKNTLENLNREIVEQMKYNFVNEDYEEKILEITKSSNETIDKLTKKINFLEQDKKAVANIIDETRASFYAVLDQQTEELDKEKEEHSRTKAELETLKQTLAKKIFSTPNNVGRSPLQVMNSLLNQSTKKTLNPELSDRGVMTELMCENESLKKEITLIRNKLKESSEDKLNQELFAKDCEINELKMHIKRQEAPLKKQIENLKQECNSYQCRIVSMKRQMGQIQQSLNTTVDYLQPINNFEHDIITVSKLREENHKLRNMISVLQEKHLKL